jgi:transglutaminase-like putative cysteine protease
MAQAITSLSAAPRFSLGAALLLWGWQTGFLVFALPMILLVELSAWVSWRWPITRREFNNVSDLSGVGFFITVVYIFTTAGTKGIFVILSVMPFVLLPLLLLQRYSERCRVPISALFVSLRRLDPASSPEAAAEIDLSLPYLLVCVVSASSGNQRTVWFFILVFVLFAMVLWSLRPQRYRVSVWAGLLALALLISYAGQEGIRDLQRSMEATLIGLFDQFMWRNRDPERASTSIGSIGRLKLSDRIMVRVDPQTPLNGTLLLREASYQKYNYGVWSNADSRYTVIDPAITGNRWTLAQGDSNRAVRLSIDMFREVGVVPLPHGTSHVRDVAAIEVNQSQYGTVKMEIREGWVSYTADFQDQLLTEGQPTDNDLVVPDNYRSDFVRLVDELNLTGKDDLQVAGTVERFFAENFTYTLTQRNRFPRGKFLSNFLFTSRAGHCEYFATATVLLLRAAGIPARYVAGYAVDEYSTMEGQFIARSRDAHSWAVAYLNGQWRVLDTTPAVWSPLEDESASSLEPFMDIYAWFTYRVSLFQSADELEEETSNSYLIYLLIPLIVTLIWRLYFKERVRKTGPDKQTVVARDYPGRDSAFYRLTAELNRAGYTRRNGETLLAWLHRIEKQTGISGLEQILRLHYRYRFDPDPASRSLQGEISAQVNALLKDGQVAGLALKNH